ncbi:hypothetical protein GRS96_01215 [Rathayibacter sp. VKM Ac-2803]|uniref:hypothetical protein n=1 Tax=unclassified Rathayibacter TaxID=2609250 RepID=UPI0013588A4A|nr:MULTISPECIES: hypothetical protein [unclassified Rathayibacter]MWV47890.1 hypothetical protein [Rathayibacter sp. VKM Ac-2803]MWV58895.1 hypothetical protein [Rathayibacter sp. VKM Ac-2754]
MFEDVPVELITIAKETRDRFAGYDELRIQREVRDALNRSRMSITGERDYVTDLETEIVDAIQAQQKP